MVSILTQVLCLLLEEGVHSAVLCIRLGIFFISVAFSILNSTQCIYFFFSYHREVAASFPEQQHLICSLISISTLSASPDGAARSAGQQWQRAKGMAPPLGTEQTQVVLSCQNVRMCVRQRKCALLWPLLTHALPSAGLFTHSNVWRRGGGA